MRYECCLFERGTLCVISLLIMLVTGDQYATKYYIFKMPLPLLHLQS